MPLLFERSFEKLQGEAMNELVNETNITRTTPGAKAKALLQIVNRKLNRSYQEFDINFLRGFLPYARGRFLDYLGDMLGVGRGGALKSEASASSRLVKFYVSTGTFGDINNNSDITIPTGTLISSRDNNGGIVYRVTAGVTLNRLLAEDYVSVEALQDGDTANVGADVLTFHNFTGYTEGVGLLVTNNGPLNTGRNLESDTNYRFRIANGVLSAERANETSIRLAVLSVPGVSSVTMRRFARGIGSFEVMVQTVIPNTPENVIEACQESIARTQGYGIDGLAVAPRLIGFTAQITVTWRNDVTGAEKEEVKSAIQENVADYINNLSIGESFILNELTERVMSTSEKILNIGTAAKPFDLLNIYRETKLRDNKLKEELIGDYHPLEDERLIIEPTVTTPVTILSAN
jgi:uncharacterized phage protein gp47/JayE